MTDLTIDLQPCSFRVSVFPRISPWHFIWCDDFAQKNDRFISTRENICHNPRSGYCRHMMVSVIEDRQVLWKWKKSILIRHHISEHWRKQNTSIEKFIRSYNT